MDPRSLLGFLILLLLSGFFSSSETAFMAVPMHKTSALLKEKKSGAKALYKLKLQPERMLIAILIGNNIVNILAASLATVIAISLAGSEGGTAVTIATVVVTILVLLFGEIFPKTLATRYAEKISLMIAPIYLVLIQIFYPLILIIEWMMKLLNKGKKQQAVSSSDLEAFIELSKDSGIFDNDEDKKIKKLISLDELTAEEVMTPRIKMKAIDDTKTLDEAIQLLTGFQYSRIPVYHDTIDQADRVVMLKELLRFREKNDGTTLLASLDLPAIIKVPRSQPLDSLLEKFQKSHKHIALVIDEYGGVDGLVSLEDIIEEVFGEIQDEQDEELTPIKPQGNGLLVQSYVRMDEILAALGLSFDALGIEEEFEAETVSYFITSHLERFPSSGEKICIPLTFHDQLEKSSGKCLEFKVVWVKKNVIGEIEVMIIEKDMDAEK